MIVEAGETSGCSASTRSRFSYQRCGNGYTVVTALLALWSSQFGLQHFWSHKGVKALRLNPMGA